MKVIKLFSFLLIVLGLISCNSHQNHLEFKIQLLGTNNQNDIRILKDRIFELSGETPQISELPNSIFYFKLNSFQDSGLIYQTIQTKGDFDITESYDVKEFYPILEKINRNLVVSNQLPDYLKNDSMDFVRNNPLFSLMMPSSDGEGNLVSGPTIGYMMVKDTSRLLHLFNAPEAKALMPFGARIQFGKLLNETTCPVYVQKIDEKEDLSILPHMFEDIRVKLSEVSDGYEIIITLKAPFKNRFAKLTHKNILKGLIIKFDNLVLSAPIVQSEVIGGKFTINANLSKEESIFIATCLKTGVLTNKPIVQDFGFVKNN
ncbi:MAG: SecDF P1 head subdomain-containing protein [Bacteroidia bacterium]